MTGKPNPLPPWREYLLDQSAARHLDLEAETGYHVGHNLTDMHRLFGKPGSHDPLQWIESNPAMIEGVTEYIDRLTRDKRAEWAGPRQESAEPYEPDDWGNTLSLTTHGVIETWPVKFLTDGSFDHVIPGTWREGDLVTMWEVVARLYAWFLDYEG